MICRFSKKNVSDDNMAELVPFLTGLRVVRGPDWRWSDQDGGEGHVGTVVEVGEPSVSDGGRAVVVQWDCGERPGKYRCGIEGKYDLRVLDSAPTGLSFPNTRCYGCRKEGFSGLLWRCTRCSEYQLCSKCYMADYHSVEHQFNCVTTKDGRRVKVLPRSGLKKVEAKGLFAEARVVRGRDWKWKDQDGGIGSVGKVVSVTDWKNETTRSVVEVKWPRTHKTNLYRAGHRGKVDLHCTEPGSGGLYYPEHLPVLGALYQPSGAKEFSSGDRVKCDLDMEILSLASAAGDGADEHVLMLLDHVGVVEEFLQNGDLHVRYPNNSLLPVSPEGAYKVSIPLFQRGDVVRVIEDMAEVFSLQKGHGEWVDDMALSLGQLGVVLKVMPSDDVRLATGGRKWTMNPLCLLPAPGEAPPLIADADADIDFEMRMKLMALSQAMDPDLLVVATAAGDISTMRSFLSESPDKVNSVCQGRTALHVAIQEGSPSAVKLLLEHKANLDLQDKQGEKPLHTCAYVNSLECAKLLLDAGGDVNCRNSKDNTPLMVAAAVGHYNVLKLFLSLPNIDINAQDFAGKTALHHSVSTHRSLSVAMLLDAGADPTLFSFLGFTPIHDAAGLGFLVAIEEFMARYPEHVNYKRVEDENTALHIAAANNRLEVLKHLCTIPSVDINIKNNRNHTPLHCTSIEGHGTIIEALVGYGADLNAADTEGNTALHIILIKKVGMPPNEDLTPQIMKVQRDIHRIQGTSSVAHYMTLVCFLAQQGADVHLRNRRGQSAMNMIPVEMTAAVMNFINDMDRGAFHGSLTNSEGASVVPQQTENRPLHQVAEAVTPRTSPTPQTSDSPHPHPVTEAVSKHNSGNQEWSQQELAITSTSSTVKGLGHRKIPSSNRSPRFQRANLEMDETLKEKARFSPRHSLTPPPLSTPPTCSDPVSLGSLRGAVPSDALQSCEDRVDSNKLTFSEKPTVSPSAGSMSSIQSLLYETRERRMQKSAPDLSERSIVVDTCKSGSSDQEREPVVAVSATAAAASEAKSTTESPLCFLCDDIQSNVKFIPCGHIVMCNICSKRTQKCPHCQNTIKEKIELH